MQRVISSATFTSHGLGQWAIAERNAVSWVRCGGANFFIGIVD
jgi:hypothetical protein